MKRVSLSFIFFLVTSYPDVSAQTRSRNSSDSTTTIRQSSLSTGLSSNTPVKSDETLLKEFTPYAPTEVALIIPDVSFGEKSVENLISAIKKDATVRQASLYYKNRLAVVTITQKTTATFDFWNSIPYEIQVMFPVKTRSSKSMLVTFDPEQRQPKNEAPVNGMTARSATDQTTTSQRRTQPVQTNAAGNSVPKSNDIATTNKTENQKNNAGALPPRQNNTSEEKQPENPYADALKKVKLGKEGAFIEFKRNGTLYHYNEVMVTITPSNTGIGLQFLDLRKSSMIALIVTNGDNEVTTGTYNFFPGNNPIIGNAKDFKKYPEVVFFFDQQKELNTDEAKGAAMNVTTSPSTPQNLVSGTVEFTNIEVTDEGLRIEGIFRFETKETKVANSNRVFPATVITEGKFVAIPGGMPIIK